MSCVCNLTLDHFTNPAQNWYTSKSSDCAEVNHILLPCWEKAERAVKWRSAQVWSRSVWEWRRFSSALVRGIYEAHWCECKTLRAAPQLVSAFTSTRVYSEPKPSCRHSSPWPSWLFSLAISRGSTWIHYCIHEDNLWAKTLIKSLVFLHAFLTFAKLFWINVKTNTFFGFLPKCSPWNVLYQSVNHYDYTLQ